MAIAEVLKEMGKRHGCTAGAVAIAWTLRNPAVTGAIVGGRSAAQVEQTAGAGEIRLTESDLHDIETILHGN